ncbi:unnamed protein product [Lactuca virosa]|uniref:Uncharacterized protein n=1 Tax=Lactuca virosa TaxID=75947 RepID=A0AAU9NCK3_9ASTR|nr:unnamed protein product [Lactuca virosa]
MGLNRFCSHIHFLVSCEIRSELKLVPQPRYLLDIDREKTKKIPILWPSFQQASMKEKKQKTHTIGIGGGGSDRLSRGCGLRFLFQIRWIDHKPW